MEPESAPSLRSLFEAALPLTAPARTQFLDRNCADAGLRAEVERLLAADAIESDALLLGDVDAAARAIGDPDIAQRLPAGSRIGTFELIEVLGEGGSSTVFRARRETDGVRQEVALKLLRRGLYSPDAQRQFRRERQALAQLRHPGIARLIEGGVTENGLAYIALELVEGKSLTEHVREHRLNLRQRLKLFLQVCAAVEAAHRSLIVHRDLKPSNVLVTEDAQVKLLDFGIAKLLDSDDESATRLPAFTPAYAAPEQRSGAPITTATDVYALGVLLGELITGQRLSGQTSQTPSALVSADSEPGVLPASAPLTRRFLRGDLDNIVLKAIEAEPERRYVSAGALAEDIERLLDGRPVAAHPPSTWYRARKFIGRHRGGVATTVLFLLAIFAALGLALWQANVARHEAHRANTVRDFVESIFDPLDAGEPTDKQPSLRELLATAVEQLDHASGLGARERVDLLLMFARLDNKVGAADKGQALADRASALAEAELGPNDNLTLDALLTASMDALYREDYQRAAPEFKRVEQRLLAHPGGDRLLILYSGMMKLANERGDPARALTYAHAALAERNKKYGPDSQKVGDGYYNLGYALEAAGQFDAAAKAYRRVHEIDLLHLAPGSFDLVTALGGEGAAELFAGQLHAGRDHLREALQIADHVGGKPRDVQASFAEQLCFAGLTMAPAEAGDSCAHATQLDAAIFGASSARYGLGLRLAGMLAIERGDLAGARATLNQSATLLAAADNVGWRGRTAITLGEIDLIEGRSDEAVRSLTTGIEQFGKSYPPHLRRIGLALLALTCDRATAPNCPPDAFERASAELAAVSYQWNPMLLPAQIALARIDLAHARVSAASERLRTAIAHAENEVDPAQPRLLEARLWLADSEGLAGDCDKASGEAKAAQEIIQHNRLGSHPLLATALHALVDMKSCTDLLP